MGRSHLYFFLLNIYFEDAEEICARILFIPRCHFSKLKNQLGKGNIQTCFLSPGYSVDGHEQKDHLSLPSPKAQVPLIGLSDHI